MQLAVSAFILQLGQIVAAPSVQHRQFAARCLTLCSQMFNPYCCREQQVGTTGAVHGGREGGKGLEITCRWGSLQPLCQHGWNENKVMWLVLLFFFFLWRPVRRPSTTLQAELHAPFQKGTTEQEMGPTSPIQCWLCARCRPSALVGFLHCGHKEWKKKEGKKG